MTVNLNPSRIVHSGDGLSTTFAVPFYFLEDRHLLVYADGQLRQLSVHYSVAGAGADNGGSVIFGTAPPVGTGNVVILREPDLTQNARYPANDPFPAKSHETALDKLTMICQRFQDRFTRVFKLADTDTSGASLDVPSPAPTKFLRWNTAGTGLENADVIGGGDIGIPVPLTQGGTNAITAAGARNTLGITTGTGAAEKFLPLLIKRQPVTRTNLNNAPLAAADNGSTFVVTSPITQAIAAIASLPTGWWVEVHNKSSGILTFDPNGAETIDGFTTFPIFPDESCCVLFDGAVLRMLYVPRGKIKLAPTIVASNTPSVDWVGLFNATMDVYEFTFINVIPTMNSVEFWARILQSGSFKSGANDYLWVASGGAATTLASYVGGSGGAGSSAIPLAGILGNGATTRNTSGVARVLDPLNTTIAKLLTSEVASNNTSPELLSRELAGQYIGLSSGGTAAAWDGFQLRMSAGNISAGKFAAYGWRN